MAGQVAESDRLSRPVPIRTLVGVYRLAFCVLTAAAIVHSAQEQTIGMPNFVSYFTNESNALTVLVFGWGALAATGLVRLVPDALRGATALYMAITGLVYALLLSGLETGTTPWTNTVMHKVMPIVLVLDWLIDPPRRRLSFGRSAWWLVFPIVFLGYSLIRGPLVAWYPYPFLDPRSTGYPHVVITCVCIAAGFVLIGALLVLLGRLFTGWRGPVTASDADSASAS